MPHKCKFKENYVISGISGRYPDADSLDVFWDKLINGIPLYSNAGRRWPVGK